MSQSDTQAPKSTLQGVAEDAIRRSRERSPEEVARFEKEQREIAEWNRKERETRSATARGLPPSEWGTTFEAFDVRRAPLMRPALAAVKKVLIDGGMLLLYGGWGTGKTHLSYAACNELRLARKPYRFIRANDFAKLFRDAIGENKRYEKSGHYPDSYMTPDDWLRTYSGRFLLVIDDWGKNQGGAYQEANLFDVIDARYRAGNPTIITTNCDIKDIDGAIVSRFAGGLIPCDGKDQRFHG